MGSLFLYVTYLCTIGLSLYTSGWLILKADRNDTTGALAACQALVIIWCIPQLFVGAAKTLEMKYLAYGISYVGISFIGPAWLEFSFRYCKKQLGLRKRVALFGISALNFSAFLSNDSHHLFYLHFSVGQVVYGPVFYFHMLYTYLCVGCGLAVVLREFAHRQVAAVHLALIFLSAAVPLGVNLLYITGLAPSVFDLTPPAFALSSLLMLLAVFRYDFLDVNTMAFGQIFASVAEGVAVYNQWGHLTYCNEAARRWLKTTQGDGWETIRNRMSELGLDSERLAQIEGRNGQGEGRTGRSACQEMEELGIAFLEDGTKLRIRQYRYFKRGGRLAAGALVLMDVSEYYELLRQSHELEQSRLDLALAQERNRIAQEVHDTTGHVLTMIQSFLRLMRAELQKSGNGTNRAEESTAPAGKEAVYEYLDQAQMLVSDGIRELRCAINQMRQERARLSVTEGVARLAESVRAIEVETEFLGEDGERYMELSPIVCSCLREAITNCLRHADATHMDVIVRFEPDKVCLYVFDNGQGCGTVAEGNGIKGIRERARIAGGTVRIVTAEGEGFQIYMELPIKENEGL